MKIAIVGAGIAGLTSAYYLCRRHDITVFESSERIGGHSHTVRVREGGREVAVDTGFVVFNDGNYPLFARLLRELGVETQRTSMSFSVRSDRFGIEYNGSSLNGLFAQRRNACRPRFLRMLGDIARFQIEALALCRRDAAGTSVGAFVSRGGYGPGFVQDYLTPLGSALWSVPPGKFLQFPIRFVVDFLDNHGMLRWGRRPVWRVIRGGSWQYVKRLARPFASRIFRRAPVVALQRSKDRVRLADGSGQSARFDHAILACHADQALRILEDPSPLEEEILGAFPYQENRALLHTDPEPLPRRRRSWASWNYRVRKEAARRATVTYNMNHLQGIPGEHPVQHHPQRLCGNRRAPGLAADELRAPRVHGGQPGGEGVSQSGRRLEPYVLLRSVLGLRISRGRRPERCQGLLCPRPGVGAMNSCLYRGWVRHRRFVPLIHEFRYRMFQVCLDLAEVESVFAGRWLWSTGRFAVAWFRREDHLGDPSIPLEEAVRRVVAGATGVRPEGPIRLLTHLRYFGYVMNPVSFYYCLGEAGRGVEFIVAEIHNTPWGERHCYTFAVETDRQGDAAHRFEFPKGFHVSPFMGMDQDYRWTFSALGDLVAIHMESFEADRPMFDATLRMKRDPISGHSLARALLLYPLMTLQVLGGIYWQALKLFLKKCPFHEHPRHAPQTATEPPCGN